MYLSKKQVSALNTALEALELGIQNNIQPEESSEAIDVILKMLNRNKLEGKRKININIKSKRVKG